MFILCRSHLSSEAGQKPIISETLELPKELRVSQSVGDTSSPKGFLDSSNSYVAYCRPNPHSGQGPSYPDSFALFRLNLYKTSSPQLQPSLPEDMLHVTLKFHPSLPLLVLGYELMSEIEAIDFSSNDANIPLHVLLIDLNTLSRRAVSFEPGPHFCGIKRSEICQAFSAP